MNTELLRLTNEATSALGNDTPEEKVIEAMEFLAALKEATRELAETVEQRVIAWIGANHEIEVGDVRYYVAPNKTTKCKNLAATLEAVLKATGGDFYATVMSLSSSAFKHGACREVLPPDEFEVLFETVEVLDLKEGKPRKRLQKVNERMLNERSSMRAERLADKAD